jgi:hypothetical protein
MSFINNFIFDIDINQIFEFLGVISEEKYILIKRISYFISLSNIFI